MIQTKSLVKKYGRMTAVNNIDLTIHPGEIYGFLGPNGAGKTTTIMMLLGLSKPTSGEISLFGEKYNASRLDLKRRIGVVPEKHPVGMWSWMTGFEYLSLFADIFQVENKTMRITYLLDKVYLSEFRNKQISGYSRGMLQKLSIIRALLHDPDILFLDEPISGLDPIGIKQIRDLILEENRDGRTVFISSHLLSEMEKICHRVAIIYKGKLLLEDKMQNLLNTLVKEYEISIELETIPDGLSEKLMSLPYVNNVIINKNILSITVTKEGTPRKNLSRYLIDNGMIPIGIEEKNISLEDAFISITMDNINMFTGIGGTQCS